MCCVPLYPYSNKKVWQHKSWPQPGANLLSRIREIEEEVAQVKFISDDNKKYELFRWQYIDMPTVLPDFTVYILLHSSLSKCSYLPLLSSRLGASVSSFVGHFVCLSKFSTNLQNFAISYCSTERNGTLLIISSSWLILCSVLFPVTFTRLSSVSYTFHYKL